jgi:hypothetical protein
MNYVLSVIHPPVPPAAYGRAVTPAQDPFTSLGSAVKLVVWVLSTERPGTATLGDAKVIGRELMDAPGREFRHAESGLTFRIDPADDAPHPCPCCERLVLPGDHALAHHEDALCEGCYTWARGVTACQPGRTAHTEEP